MASKLKYTVIKGEEQYYEYCNLLEQLILKQQEEKDESLQDEIDLLTLLIEDWDEAHNTFDDLNPVELLKHLMQEHNLKQIQLSGILGTSKSLVSDILNYKRGFSKEVIRKLSKYFKVNQEAFNRYYRLNTNKLRQSRAGTKSRVFEHA